MKSISKSKIILSILGAITALTICSVGVLADFSEASEPTQPEISVESSTDIETGTEADFEEGELEKDEAVSEEDVKEFKGNGKRKGHHKANKGEGKKAKCVDADEDGVCDNFVDENEDGICDEQNKKANKDAGKKANKGFGKGQCKGKK